MSDPSVATTHPPSRLAGRRGDRHAITRPSSEAVTDRPWAADIRLLLRAMLLASMLAFGLYTEIEPAVLLGAALMIGMGLVRPDIALAALLLVAPLLTRPVLPAPGFQFFAVGAIVLGSVYRLPLDRPRLGMSPVFALLVAFVAYIFVQQLPDMLAGYPTEQMRDIGSMLAKILTGLGLVLATSLVVRGRSPYPYLAVLLISVTVAAVAGIITFIDAETATLLGGLLAEGEFGARASGLFANPNYFGQFMSAGVVLGIGWYAAWGKGRVRPLLLVALGIIGTALLVSQSRGALIALASGLIAAAFARSRKTGIVTLVVALAAVAVLAPLVLEARLERNATFDPSAALERQAQSDGYRADVLAMGPDLLATSPLFGIGLFHFTLETGLYPHNWFLRLFTEHGLVGLVMTIAILYFAFRQFASLATMPRTIAMGFLGLVVVGSVFTEPQGNIQSFLLLAFMLTVVVSADWTAGRAKTGRSRAPQ